MATMLGSCGCCGGCVGVPKLGDLRVRIHTPSEDVPSVMFNSNATDDDKNNFPNNYEAYTGTGQWAGNCSGQSSSARISFGYSYDFCTGRYDVYRSVEITCCTTEVLYFDDDGNAIYGQNCIPIYPFNGYQLIGTATESYTDFALDKDKLKPVIGGTYTADTAPYESVIGLKWCAFSYPYSGGSRSEGYIYTSQPFCIPDEDYPDMQIINTDGLFDYISGLSNDALSFTVVYGYPDDKNRYRFI